MFAKDRMNSLLVMRICPMRLPLHFVPLYLHRQAKLDIPVQLPHMPY